MTKILTLFVQSVEYHQINKATSLISIFHNIAVFYYIYLHLFIICYYRDFLYMFCIIVKE